MVNKDEYISLNELEWILLFTKTRHIYLCYFELKENTNIEN